MKKILNFLILAALSAGSTSLLTSCGNKIERSNNQIPFKLPPIVYDDFNETTKLISLEDIETKITANAVDGSTLDELAPIGSNINKSKLINLIKTIIDNKEVNVSLIAPEMNLSQTDNIVKIMISHSKEKRTFDVKFKNVKSYSEQQIDVLLDNAKSQVVNGCKLLKDKCINALESKIINIINDERIMISKFFLVDGFKNKVQLEFKVDHKIYKNKLKIFNLLFAHNITIPNDSTNLLFEEIKTKLTNNLLDGSTLDELAPIGSNINKSKLINSIETIIDNKKVNVVLIAPEMNLSQTSNIVKIMISHNKEKRTFDVKFKNVKPYSKQQIDDLLNNAAIKFKKPVSGTEFDDQMLLEGDCLNKLQNKIKAIIKDERIEIVVIRLRRTLNELKNKVKFEIKVNHKVYGCKSKQLVLTLEDVIASNWHKILNNIKKRLEKNPIDCRQLIRDNQRLDDENVQKLIKQIIKELINNKDVDLSLITKNKTLKDHKNIINIKIFNCQGNLQVPFNVTLHNVKAFKIKKLDEWKLKELEGMDLRLLLNFKNGADKKANKIHYMKCKMLLQDGRLGNFFNFWWNKIKKIDSNTNFDFVYSSLQKAVFFKLNAERIKVEKIFKDLGNYDSEILDSNEDVNQFYRYLEKLYQILTVKYDSL